MHPDPQAPAGVEAPPPARETLGSSVANSRKPLIEGRKNVVLVLLRLWIGTDTDAARARAAIRTTFQFTLDSSGYVRILKSAFSTTSSNLKTSSLL